MTEFFTAVGAVVIIVMVVAMIWGLVYAVREFIRERIWIYRYNHRFDKQPTAKCYCKDCTFYGDFGNRCLCRKHKSFFQKIISAKTRILAKRKVGLQEKKQEKKGEDE